MDGNVEHLPIIWLFIAYTVAVILIVISMMGLSHILGQKHHDHSTGEAFESGIVTSGSSNLRFSAQFYLVAMFFVIFDLEVVFIVAWAIAFRELGWIGYAAVSVFIGVLIIALIYEWKMGALDYGTNGKKILENLKNIN